MRFYVNGKKVDATTKNQWGTAVGQRADICGGQDHQSAGKFRIDNLKIWNYAKTTFEDRHTK